MIFLERSNALDKVWYEGNIHELIITGHDNDHCRRILIENNSLITFVDDLVSSGFDKVCRMMIYTLPKSPF